MSDNRARARIHKLNELSVNLRNLNAIIFDFDGVFTDNTIYLDSNGHEILRFSKSDSLGIDIFRQYLKSKNLEVQLLILTREKNSIVSLRAEKMGLECFQGIRDKWEFISKEMPAFVNHYAYFGNDINDLIPMRNASISFAPSDANPVIMKTATKVFVEQGGHGFVRAGLDFLIERDNE